MMREIKEWAGVAVALVFAVVSMLAALLLFTVPGWVVLTLFALRFMGVI